MVNFDFSQKNNCKKSNTALQINTNIGCEKQNLNAFCAFFNIKNSLDSASIYCNPLHLLSDFIHDYNCYKNPKMQLSSCFFKSFFIYLRITH